METKSAERIHTLKSNTSTNELINMNSNAFLCLGPVYELSRWLETSPRRSEVHKEQEFSFRILHVGIGVKFCCFVNVWHFSLFCARCRNRRGFDLCFSEDVKMEEQEEKEVSWWGELRAGNEKMSGFSDFGSCPMVTDLFNQQSESRDAVTSVFLSWLTSHSSTQTLSSFFELLAKYTKTLKRLT